MLVRLSWSVHHHRCDRSELLFFPVMAMSAATLQKTFNTSLLVHAQTAHLLVWAVSVWTQYVPAHPSSTGSVYQVFAITLMDNGFNSSQF